MSNGKPEISEWEAATVKNTVRLGIWTGAWLLTLAIATFGPLLLWESRPLSIVAIAINLGFGVGMIVANKHHLQGLDELHRKVQLEAMALALGVALIVGLSYSTLDVTNVIAFDAEISHLVFLIGITYTVALALGLRKYR